MEYDVHTSTRARTTLKLFPPCPPTENTISGWVLGKKTLFCRYFLRLVQTFAEALLHWSQPQRQMHGQAFSDWPQAAPAMLQMACLITALVCHTECTESLMQHPWVLANIFFSLLICDYDYFS